MPMLRDIGVHSGEIYNRKSRGTLAREGVHATRNPRYKSGVALRDQARQPLFGARVRRGSQSDPSDRHALAHHHNSLLSRSQWLPLGEGWYQASVPESGTSIKMGLHSVMDNQHSSTSSPLVILYQPRVRECFEACTAEIPFYDLEVSVKMLKPDKIDDRKDFGGAIPSSIFRTLEGTGNNNNNAEKDIMTNVKIVFGFHSFSQYTFVIVNNATQIWTLGYVLEGEEYIIEEVYSDEIKLNTFYSVLIAIRGDYLSIDVNTGPLFTSIKVPEMMIGGLSGLPGLIARGGTKFAVKGWRLRGVGNVPIGAGAKSRGGGIAENTIEREEREVGEYEEEYEGRYTHFERGEVDADSYERREIDTDGDYEYGPRYGDDTKVATSPIRDDFYGERDDDYFTYGDGNNGGNGGNGGRDREGPTSLLNFMNKQAPGSIPDEGAMGRKKGSQGNPMSLADMMAIKAHKREEKERGADEGHQRGTMGCASLMPASSDGSSSSKILNMSRAMQQERSSNATPTHPTMGGAELYSHGGGGPGRLKAPGARGNQNNSVRRTPFTGGSAPGGGTDAAGLRWGGDEEAVPNPRSYLNRPPTTSSSASNTTRNPSYKDGNNDGYDDDGGANPNPNPNPNPTLNHERRVSSAYHHLTASHDKSIVDTVLRDVVQHNPGVSFDDIAALGQAKQLLSEAVVLPLVMPEFFTGIREPWKGVLLFGPPGTGKTLLAKAVCSLNESSFFNCPSSSLVNKFRGESEKIVRCLFEAARCLAPAVIFLDEVDALVGSRGAEGEHEASRRFKTEIFSQMDGMGNSSDNNGSTRVSRVMVLATTNCPWDLDEAMRRRLEKRIYIPLPDQKARRELYVLNLRNISLEEDVSAETLSSISQGYSGADIHVMCRDAAMMPMRRLLAGCDPGQVALMRSQGELVMSSVSMEDFRLALANTRPSVNSITSQRYTKWEEEYGSR